MFQAKVAETPPMTVLTNRAVGELLTEEGQLAGVDKLVLLRQAYATRDHGAVDVASAVANQSLSLIHI